MKKTMKMAMLLVVVSLPLWNTLLICVAEDDVPREPLFSAMFVFGDSLVDIGNNNFLQTFAKATFKPYGIDFLENRPTGRFSNGKILVDFLGNISRIRIPAAEWSYANRDLTVPTGAELFCAQQRIGELVGIPYVPSYADTITKSVNVSMGVNYASASAGIIDETGRNLGEHISFSEQVRNFEKTLIQMKTLMDDERLSQHLANSFTLVNHGSNDYLNNYLLPEFYDSSSKYSPKDYAAVLIELYKKQILALHSLGLRRFMLAAIGPLGCIPKQLAQGLSPPGECRDYVNDIVVMFNALLRSMVDQFNMEYKDSIFAYGDSYTVFSEIIKNPNSYGFSINDRTCCGMGMNKGLIDCMPISIPCPDRDQYVFWDAYHPTQAVNKIIAHKALIGSSSICYPVNVLQMAQKPLPFDEKNASAPSIMFK